MQQRAAAENVTLSCQLILWIYRSVAQTLKRSSKILLALSILKQAPALARNWQPTDTVCLNRSHCGEQHHLQSVLDETKTRTVYDKVCISVQRPRVYD